MSTTFRTSAPRRPQAEPSPAPADTFDNLMRELQTASTEERLAAMPLVRAYVIANGRRVSGKPRACSCTSARTAPVPTPTATARAAASPVPPPPGYAALNSRVQQVVAARPSVAINTPVAPAGPQSLLAHLRSLLPLAPGKPRTAPKQPRTAAGTGVPQPPSLNDRINGGLW